MRDMLYLNSLLMHFYTSYHNYMMHSSFSRHDAYNHTSSLHPLGLELRSLFFKTVSDRTPERALTDPISPTPDSKSPRYRLSA